MRDDPCMFCAASIDHAYHDNQEINMAHAFDVGEPPHQVSFDGADLAGSTHTRTIIRHPSSQKFHDILTQLGELHDQKQKDYGSDNDPFKNVRNSGDFGVPAWIGCMVRANDKMKRIQTASSQVLNGDEVSMANESVEDSFMDLAVYAVIGLVLYRETHEGADQG